MGQNKEQTIESAVMEERSAEPIDIWSIEPPKDAVSLTFKIDEESDRSLQVNQIRRKVHPYVEAVVEDPDDVHLKYQGLGEMLNNTGHGVDVEIGVSATKELIIVDVTDTKSRREFDRHGFGGFILQAAFGYLYGTKEEGSNFKARAVIPRNGLLSEA